MKASTRRRLQSLNADFHEVTGDRARHFHCPILFRDEPCELCEAHIVNQAFPGSSRRWTVQRRDVDHFFGSRFEADFVLLAERGKHDLHDVIADPALSRRLRPRLLADGRVVGHYRPVATVPEAHTPIVVEAPGKAPVQLALKVEATEAMALADASWEVSLERDVRLPALVSLVKAAHLTVFDMVGYRYALSPGGHFLGWDVLGQFYQRCCALDRKPVLEAAATHFGEFINLVRPMLAVPDWLKGTIEDGHVYLCTGTPIAWAILVFVRVADQVHAVLVPLLEDAESAARLVRFLKDDSAARFEVRFGKFHGDRWEVSKTARILEWPAARFWDMPEDLAV